MTYVTHRFLIFLNIKILKYRSTFVDPTRSCPNHALCQTDQALFNMAVAAAFEITTREIEVAAIDCVALFYEEGKGGENYRKKKQVQVSGEQRRKTARQV